MNETTVYFKGLVTILACAGLFVLLAIPLILRKVPRNGVYGFRTPKTLRSDEIWYAANAFFGWGMVFSSVVTAIAIKVLYSLKGLTPEQFLTSSLVVLVAPLVLAVLFTFLHIRNLDRSP
jgi:uncharacterized membrane protein